jgi:hypothetical protein
MTREKPGLPWKGHSRSDTNTINYRLDRAERHTRSRRRFGRQAGVARLQAQMDSGKADATNRQPDGNGRVHAGAAAQGQASFIRPCQAEIKVRPHPVGG